MTPSLTPRQQHWSDLIHQWSVSGQSMAAFCRQQDINPDLFYAWKHTLKKKQSLHAQPSTTEHTLASDAFLPVLIKPDPVSDVEGITLSMGQIQLHYHTHTDDQLFLRCLRLLQEVS